MFSLFRQRTPRGFDPVTRYYDPQKEARAERLRRMNTTGHPEGDLMAERDLFAERMRHSWRRQSSSKAHLIRLMVVMGMVVTILYFIVKGFGLLATFNG